MNLVEGALRRPVTVIVIVLAVSAAAVMTLGRMPRDIFPDMGVPVIYVAQPYGGMDAAQIEGLLVNYYEYHFLYVTGIEHVESKSEQGVGLVKLQFHPGTDMAQAMAETISYVNRSRAFMPAGTVPPFVMRFDAGSVPIGQLVFSSDSKSVREIQDLALFRVRPLFATLPGVSAPPPFGASQRTIVIRADPERLRDYGITPDELVSAVTAANQVTPSGNVRIGDLMPVVPINSIVTDITALERVPVRQGALPAVFLRDVAKVEDSSDIQTGYALVNGKRTVYIPVTKRADASTLSVAELVKASVPRFQSVLPDDVAVSYEFDQTPWIVRAIGGLTFEGILGALLTAAVVLVFLHDLRSVLIVVLDIPLSLLAAVLALRLTGETINLMTLGGLALAVGILVDEAMVSIENFHTHLARGATPARAALDATTETALPRFLAMLSILAVFIPSFFMAGAARALFVPVALSVGFSMVASWLLSSTLVPVLCVLFHRKVRAPAGSRRTLFDRACDFHGRTVGLVHALRHPVIALCVLAAVFLIWIGSTRLGTEIFPSAGTGVFQLRLRAPTGTRIERTEALALRALAEIEAEAGKGAVDVTLGFVGVHPPSYPVNAIHLWTSGPEEAVLQVGLRDASKIPLDALRERLRRRLAETLPGVRISFEPGDIVGRVMSLGAEAPVEVAVSGPDVAANRGFAGTLLEGLRQVPSLRDLGIVQAADNPAVSIDVDRERAGILGVSVADVSRSLVAATSSSRFVVPGFWADPASGVGYQVQVEIPQAAMDSLEAVRNVPVARGQGGVATLLRDVADVEPAIRVAEFDRYNMQRTITITASVEGEDLGHAAERIAAAIERAGKPPPRVSVAVRGQIVPLRETLAGLRTGLLLAVAVILLLLAADFQSFRLALVVMSTAPVAASGVVVALMLSRTTLNVQSFTGAIMAIGVAIANAIMLVTFAERNRLRGASARDGAVAAARERLRPILMTSLAMTAGMLPMALGLGEGGEQTAPLGIAVVGGLVAASAYSLLVLPAVFAAAMGGSAARSASLSPADPRSAHYDGDARRAPAEA